MTQKHNGGPAFPTMDGTGHPGADGMSLRDWFAGQALANTRTHPVYDGPYGGFGTPAEIAEQAYAVADSMLAARAEGGDA